jgi:hypothetical protein
MTSTRRANVANPFIVGGTFRPPFYTMRSRRAPEDDDRRTPRCCRGDRDRSLSAAMTADMRVETLKGLV